MTAKQKYESTGQRPDSGMSLISVVVAIVLLSVGITSVSQVLTQSVSMQTIIGARTTGLDLARTYMEIVKGRDPLTVAAEAQVRVNEAGIIDTEGAISTSI